MDRCGPFTMKKNRKSCKRLIQFYEIRVGRGVRMGECLGWMLSVSEDRSRPLNPWLEHLPHPLPCLLLLVPSLHCSLSQHCSLCLTPLSLLLSIFTLFTLSLLPLSRATLVHSSFLHHSFLFSPSLLLALHFLFCFLSVFLLLYSFLSSFKGSS